MYDVTVRQVGQPIDLSTPHVLQRAEVQQILSIAMHEYPSSRADFTYNRTFFRYPTERDRFGTWDLGFGRAAWAGFYSCLLFPHGEFKLLVNLDGK